MSASLSFHDAFAYCARLWPEITALPQYPVAVRDEFLRLLNEDPHGLLAMFLQDFAHVIGNQDSLGIFSLFLDDPEFELDDAIVCDQNFAAFAYDRWGGGDDHLVVRRVSSSERSPIYRGYPDEGGAGYHEIFGDFVEYMFYTALIHGGRRYTRHAMRIQPEPLMRYLKNIELRSLAEVQTIVTDGLARAGFRLNPIVEHFQLWERSGDPREGFGCLRFSPERKTFTLDIVTHDVTIAPSVLHELVPQFGDALASSPID